MLDQNRLKRAKLIAFLAVHGLILFHLIAYYLLDLTYIGGLEMQDLFRKLIEENVLTTGALFFLTFIALGIGWGRFFCGWLCHIGLSYDFLSPFMKRAKLKMTNLRLRLSPVAAASILVWYYLWEAIAQRSKEPISIDFNATAPWELLPGPLKGILILVIVLLILPIFLGERAFCRNLCPWGILLGMSNKISFFKIRKVKDCTLCGACNTNCPMGIDVSLQINQKNKINDLSCTQCFNCVAACPSQSLAFTIPNKQINQLQPTKKQAYSLSLPQEIFFWMFTTIVGLTYAETYGIGIFLAYCLGLILATLTLNLARSPKRSWVMIILLCITWSNVFKDSKASYHYQMGHKTFLKQDFEHAQYHYEQADLLFWYSPNQLFYQLYRIYKSTNQPNKAKLLYDRYEERRARQKK